MYILVFIYIQTNHFPVSKYAMLSTAGLSIINVSRGILNYGSGTIEDIRCATEEYTEKIREIL